jgi:hypothetical protein
MSLADPLGLTALYDLLRIQNVDFKPMWMQQQSATGGGETRYADRAPMRWAAEITTVAMEHAEAEGIMALLNSRGGGLKALLLTNPRLPYPSSDPDGSIIGATVPALGTITDRLHVAFTGLPAGYIVPLGTFFSIVFDTSRYYLGQFAEARTADGSGAVASVEIWPPLPASIAGTPAISIKKPSAKFRLVPNAAFISEVSTIHSRVTFAAEQTYGR